MSNKHTPGPWKVSNAIDGRGHTMATVIEDVKGPFREICRSYDLEPDDINETVANARLIAAAPELLAACEVALKLAEEMSEGDLYDQIKNAIAKAKGEQ